MNGADRARKWRAAMRAKGLRPRTFWVPDTRLPEVRERLRQDGERLNAWYAANQDVLDELDAMRARLPDEGD